MPSEHRGPGQATTTSAFCPDLHSGGVAKAIRSPAWATPEASGHPLAERVPWTKWGSLLLLGASHGMQEARGRGSKGTQRAGAGPVCAREEASSPRHSPGMHMCQAVLQELGTGARMQHEGRHSPGLETGGLP